MTTTSHDPGETLTPVTVEDLVEMVRATARIHPRLLIAGAGTASAWGGPPEPADAVLDTTAMTHVAAYNAADMTVAVGAGTRWSDLQAMLAVHGQRVALDPARAAYGATVGGLLATADAGPLRASFGSLRDLVIGTTVVLGDGTVARSGGHVIKNVAGYDLAKLFHGSLGTLGAVAEVVLRLHPLPRGTATIAVTATAAEALDLLAGADLPGLDGAAAEWQGDSLSDCGVLLVRLEGTQAGVERRAARLCRTGAGKARLLSDADADAAWAAVGRVSTGEPGGTVARLGTLPSAAPAVVADVAAWARTHGVGCAVTSSLPVGVHTVALSPAPAGVHRRLLAHLTERFGGLVVVRRDGLSGTTPSDATPDGPPPWAVPPATAALMGAVKRQLDPADRFGTQRLGPWLSGRESS